MYNRNTADMDQLIAALSSDDLADVERTRDAIRQQGKRAMNPLVQAMNGSDNPRIRWEAADILAAMHDPATAPAFVAALESGEFGIQWIAADALIALGRVGLTALLRELEEKADSAPLRNGAHHIIRKYVKQDHVDALIPVLQALEEPGASSTVGVAAFLALGHLERVA